MVTVWIIVATAALLIGWDIFVAVTPQGGDTISEVLLTFARRHPALPFAFGVLMGHLFWPQQIICEKCEEKQCDLA